VALVCAPPLFPPERAAAPGGRATGGRLELALRLLAGALLTVTVTWLASTLGARWSGLLAVFPILGTILAVFSHRASGAACVATLLRAMVTGLQSFALFCFVLALALPAWGIAAAFGLAAAAALTVQAVTGRRLAPARGRG